MPRELDQSGSATVHPTHTQSPSSWARAAGSGLPGPGFSLTRRSQCFSCRKKIFPLIDIFHNPAAALPVSASEDVHLGASHSWSFITRLYFQALNSRTQ